MEDYQAPCYPLTEASEILGMSLTELKYHIETGDIQAVLYTKPRRMLLFGNMGFNQWIGCATCEYRGHLKVKQHHISTLLDNEPVTLGQDSGRLLDASGIRYLSNHYPYCGELPLLPIKEWKSFPKEEILQRALKVSATPLPIEKEPAMKSLADTVKAATSTIGNPEITSAFSGILSYSGPNYVLDLNENSVFSPDDLRIPTSEVNQFLAKQKSKAQEKRLIESVKASSPRSSGKRENQLHTLMERILIKFPKASTKEVWKIIEQEVESDDPVFDTDRILRQVDADCIEWCSRYGAECSMSWSAFGTRLSKIRKKLDSFNKD